MPNNAQKPANTGGSRSVFPCLSFVRSTHSQQKCTDAGDSNDAGVPHSSRSFRDEWGTSSANSNESPNSDYAISVKAVSLYARPAQVLPHHQLPHANSRVRNDFYSCIPVRSAAPTAVRDLLREARLSPDAPVPAGGAGGTGGIVVPFDYVSPTPHVG